MPILDGPRTELAAPMSSGATAMYFDLLDFIAFDCFILERMDAQNDYENNWWIRQNIVLKDFQKKKN